MLRILGFFGLLLCAAFGLAWLADQPGSLTLNFGGQSYEVSLLIAGLVLIGVTMALMLVLGLLRLALRLPGIISLSSRMRRRAKGLAAISSGMIAVGSGDARAATRHAGDAVKLLGNEPLTLLLKAQAAQLSGNRGEAEAAFSGMLESDETRVLGLRGLYVEASRRGDREAARNHAEEAHRFAPGVPWSSHSVLEHACADGDWTRAIAAVDRNASLRVIAKPEARRQKAVLLTAQAIDTEVSAPDDALKFALSALKLEPGLVPAARLAGHRLSEKGDFAKGSRILEAAWKLGPHPDLAQTYLDMRRGDSALDRLKRAKNLARLLPENREGRLALADAALAAKEFTLARATLEPIVLEKPTARACILMAELEEAEHNREGAIREWLSRASRAPRDPAWVADGVVSERWAPVSPVTGRIDAFEWREPPQALEAGLRARLDVEALKTTPGRLDASDAVVISQATAPAAMDVAQPAQPDLLIPKRSSLPTTQMAGEKAVMSRVQNSGPIIFPVPHAPDDPGLTGKRGGR